MADVNEEIVAQYLKLIKKWLYVTDVSFPVPSNYSNIDLIAYEPRTGKYYDIEVKYRSAFSIAATNRSGRDISNHSVKWLVKQFTAYPNREQIFRQLTNTSRSVKVLVTTRKMMGKSKEKRVKLETAFREGIRKEIHRNSEIWYFDEMIPQLVDHVQKEGRYNTELLQTIRLLKVYGKTKYNTY